MSCFVRATVGIFFGVRAMSSQATKNELLKDLAKRCLRNNPWAETLLKPEDYPKLRAAGLEPKAIEQEFRRANCRAWDGDPMAKFHGIFTKYGVSVWDFERGPAVDPSAIRWTSYK